MAALVLSPVVVIASDQKRTRVRRRSIYSYEAGDLLTAPLSSCRF